MGIFACLIAGTLTLDHKDGETFNLGVATVRYVKASDLVDARKKSIHAFTSELKRLGSLSNVKLDVRKSSEKKFWAILSKTAWFASNLAHNDWKVAEPNLIAKTIKYHRYMS